MLPAAAARPKVRSIQVTAQTSLTIPRARVGSWAGRRRSATTSGRPMTTTTATMTRT